MSFVTGILGTSVVVTAIRLCAVVLDGAGVVVVLVVVLEGLRFFTTIRLRSGLDGLDADLAGGGAWVVVVVVVVLVLVVRGASVEERCCLQDTFSG